MTSNALRSLVAALRDELGSAGKQIVVTGSVPGAAAPRFELFNGADSICSQKVRSVLAHHTIPYCVFRRT